MGVSQITFLLVVACAASSSVNASASIPSKIVWSGERGYKSQGTLGKWGSRPTASWAPEKMHHFVHREPARAPEYTTPKPYGAPHGKVFGRGSAKADAGAKCLFGFLCSAKTSTKTEASKFGANSRSASVGRVPGPNPSARAAARATGPNSLTKTETDVTVGPHGSSSSKSSSESRSG